jgi:peptidoglycan/LPS O-acetylase OafA/YrhL
MYILLSFLILLKKKKIITSLILVISFVLLLIGNIFFFDKLKVFGFIIDGGRLLDLGVFFIAGSLLATLNIEKMKRKKELLLIIIVLLILSFCFNFYNYSKYLTLPLLFILFGLIPIPSLCNIGKKIGDLSYGIYIYGFPIQQTLIYFFKLNYLELMFFSLILSYIFAYFSWHLIEENALKLKKYPPTKWFRKKSLKYFNHT